MTERCGTKIMAAWVPDAQSLFCTLPKGHDGLHAWQSDWTEVPAGARLFALVKELRTKRDDSDDLVTRGSAYSMCADKIELALIEQKSLLTEALK